MKHLDSGDLRRMLDEPESFSQEAQAHAQTCAECGERRAALAAAAHAAQSALSGDIHLDAAQAYEALRERAYSRREPSRWYSPLTAGAIAAAFVAALLLSPLGGYARSFLTVFEPRQFAPIEVSRADLRDLRLLPQADDVGTQRVVRKPQRAQYDSIAAAQQHTAFRIARPGTLPSNLGSVHTYSVTSPGEMTFTFDARKARAFERRSHKALPAMPPTLDGTTVRLRTGQVFDAHYEGAGRAGSSKGSYGTPFLEVIEAAVPHVTSTGASLDLLERYLLSMPNVSPNLAAQVRALGDIQNTVPVPVVIDKQSARSVTVHGVKGLAIGDNTGLGAGVMWQSGGTIFVVAGPLSMDEVMTVANGLR